MLVHVKCIGLRIFPESMEYLTNRKHRNNLDVLWVGRGGGQTNFKYDARQIFLQLAEMCIWVYIVSNKMLELRNRTEQSFIKPIMASTSRHSNFDKQSCQLHVH